MNDGIGSFVVNIRAQIEGYQEQINKIKSELEKVGKETDIGKEIARSLKNAETQVNRLGKTLEKRISSESQLVNLMDNLENINSLIIGMGEAFEKVSWDDLNVDPLRDSIREAESDIEKLKQEMQDNLSKGIKEALSSSEEMRNVFRDLKIDPKKLSIEEITEKLKNGLTDAQDKVNEFQNTLNEATESAAKAGEKVGEIGANLKNVQDAKNSFAQLFEVLETIKDTKINDDNFTNFWTNVEDRLQQVGTTVDAQGQEIIDKIRNLILEMASSTNPAEIENNLKTINSLFTKLTGKNLAANIEGFGLKIGEIFNSLTTTDIKQTVESVQKFRDELTTLFQKNNNFGMTNDEAKSYIENLLGTDSTKSAINSAKDKVKTLISNYYKEVSEEDKKARSALSGFNRDKESASTSLKKAQDKEALIRSVQVKYEADIQRLTQENESLKARLSEIEEILRKLNIQKDVRNSKNSNPLAPAGGEIKEKGEDNLNNLGNMAKKYNGQLEQVIAKEKLVGNIQTFVQRWFSVYAAARLVSKAFSSMKSNLKELDDIMTQIAIVTDKTQGDLWAQMPQYSAMAKEYATSIKGVYQVSQLYYQQGLEQNEVMALTEQTLKMAKISGLEYATATDYMTNAIRSFKMEMSDSQKVVDVYSQIAANSATSTSELANAMSKTASSAESVGSSFESTTAMMAVMIEATRESAENIGSAMKSIISRYGEMKSDPTKLIDSEGEVMSLNKVDTALQSVGISIHDAQGQFRDFDDVIMELSQNWDKIDKNTQRYIATIMAGNRQQSRFLALVSNGERLQELTEQAANAEDAATLQVLKTMDSVSAKAQQLQTSLQGLYTEGGFEELYKWILDISKNIIETFNGMPKLFNSIPAPAIAMFAQLFINIGGLVTQAVEKWKEKYTTIRESLEKNTNEGVREGVTSAQGHVNNLVTMFEIAATRIKHALSNAISEGTNTATNTPTDNALAGTYRQFTESERSQFSKHSNMPGIIDAYDRAVRRQDYAGIEREARKMQKYGVSAPINAPQPTSEPIPEPTESSENKKNNFVQWLGDHKKGIGTTLRSIGAALQVASMAMDKTTESGKKLAAGIGLAGGALSAFGYIAMGNWPMAIVTGITTAIKAFDDFNETTKEKIEKYNKNITDTNNSKLQSKDDLKTLTDYKKKYDELKKTRDLDATSRKQWQEINNEIASKYPELINNMDAEGNYLVEMTSSYEKLRDAKLGVYKQDFLANMSAELEGLNDIDYVLSHIYGLEPLKGNMHGILGALTGVGSFNGDQFASQLAATELDSASIISAFSNRDFMTVGTAEDLFNQNIPLDISGDYTYWNNLTQQFEFKSEGLQELGNVILGFVEAAEEELDLEKAKTKLLDSKKFKFAQTADIIEGFQSDVYNIIQGTISALNFQSDLLKNKVNAGNKEWLNITGEIYSLDPSDLTAAAAAQTMFEQWQDFYDAQKHRLNTLEIIKGKGVTVNAGTLYQEFLQTYTGDWYNGFITLNQKLQNESLNALYKQSGKYSRAKFTAKLNELNITEELQEQILKIYDSEYQSIIDDFSKGFKSLNQYTNNVDLQSRINALSEVFGKAFGPEYLDTIINQYSTILKNTNLTEFQKTNQFNKLTDIYGKILSSSDSEKILDLMQNADLTSLSGIYSFISELKKQGINLDENELKQALIDLGNSLTTNLTTEFASFSKTIAEQAEDFNKILSKASKGMDLKDALEAAERMGVSISEFDFRDGKFFFDDANKIYETYVKYNTDLETALNKKVKNLQGAIDHYDLNSLFESATIGIKNGDEIEDALKSAFEVQDIEVTDEEISKVAEIYQNYYEAAKAAGKSVEDYINEQITQGQEELIVIRDALEYQKNVTLIQAGKIEDFLDNLEIKDQDKKDILESIEKGKFEQLSAYPKLAEYINVIQEAVKNINSDINNSLISSIKEGPQYIKVNELNKDLLSKLSSQGLAHAITDASGKVLGYFLELTADNIDQYVENIKNDPNLTQGQKKSGLQEAHDFKYKNQLDALTNFTNDTVNYSSILDFAEAVYGDVGAVDQVIKDFDLHIDEATGNYIRGQNTLSALQIKLSELKASNADQKSINELEAQIAAAENKPAKNLSEVTENILKNRNSLSESVIEDFANVIKGDFNDLIETGVFTNNGDGTYSVNISKLVELIKNSDGKVNEEYINHLYLLINEIQKEFSDATSMLSSGMKNQSEVGEFVKKYNEALEANATAEDLTFFDKETNTWKINRQAYVQYQNALIQTLRNAEVSEETIANILEVNSEELRNAIDINSFTKHTGSRKAQNKLLEQLKDYYAALYGSIGHGNAEGTAAFIDLTSDDALVRTNRFLKINPEASKEELDEFVNARAYELKDALELVADKTKTQINDTIEQGTELAKALEEAGFTIEYGEEGQGVITSLGNLEKAREILLKALFSEDSAIANEYLDTKSKTEKVLENLKSKKSDFNREKEIARIANGTTVGADERAAQAEINEAGKTLMELSQITDVSQAYDYNKDGGPLKILGQSISSLMGVINEYQKNKFAFINAYADEANATDEEIADAMINEINNIKSISDLDNLDLSLADKLETTSSNKVYTEIEKKRGELEFAISNAVNEMQKSSFKVTDEQLGSLASALNIKVADLKEKLKIEDYTDPNNGIYDISDKVDELNQIIEEAKAEGVNVSKYLDDTISVLTATASGVLEGFTSFESMENFSKDFFTMTGLEVSVTDLFDFDEKTSSFKLNSSYITQYIEALRKQLESLTDNKEYIDNAIQIATQSLLSDNLDIANYLSGGQTKEEFKKSIKAALSVENSDNYLKKAQIRQNQQSSFGKSQTLNEIINDLADIDTEAILSEIEKGPREAIEAAKKLGIKDEDKLKAISEAGMAKMRSDLDQIDTLIIGNYVGTTGKLAEFLKDKGIVDKEGFVISVDKLEEAWEEYYQTLIDSATTAAEIFEAAKAKNHHDNKGYYAQQSMLSNNVTYDSIMDYYVATFNGTKEEAEKLVEGLNLEEAGLQEIAPGQYKVINWENYRSFFLKDIPENSQEYIDAYTNYLKQQDSEDLTSTIISMLPNIHNITYDEISTIAKILNSSVSEIQNLITKNADGSYDATNLLNLEGINKNSVVWQEAWQKHLEDLTSNITSDTIALIEGTAADSQKINLKNNLKDLLREENYSKYEELAAKFSIIPNLKEAVINSYIEEDASNFYDTLMQGGEVALNELKKHPFLLGNLTASQIEEIYNSEFNKYKDAAELLTNNLQEGQLIANKTTQAILGRSGEIKFDENGVVTEINNLSNAWHNLYAEMVGVTKTTTKELNNIYAQIIKSNTSKDNTAYEMLSSASNLSVDALNNFATNIGFTLDNILNENGEVISGWKNSIERVGVNNYQVKDWNLYIKQIEANIGHKLDQTSSDYINSYINWLQSEANTAPEAKEALMTSLISNLEKLTYAEIGQIAKTFNMTVEQVLALIENNGDNTFNANALLNELDFDKSNKEYQKALTDQMQSVTSNMISNMISYVESVSTTGLTENNANNLRQSISNFQNGMQALGIDAQISINKLQHSLLMGGQEAVSAAQEIAELSKQELSTTDIQTLYQGQISKYVNAIDTVIAQPGEIIDSVTASIISANGGKVNELGSTGQYVVETAANLYEAYNDLLHRIAGTGEATLADLNRVTALALENRDGEQQVIDALSSAAGMTFTQFGEILTNAGIQLTEQMIDNLEAAGIIDLMGGNKMKIIDFQAFADLMNWDANSEEYLSAFKVYNDSLIQMNRQAERNILEEVQNVANAKGGDWINLTQLMDSLKDQFKYEGSEKISLSDSLSASVQAFGARVENGILKLEADANIPAILEAISQAAAESGNLLSNELAELADAVADTIKGYADLIRNGISGSLTNVQAEQLQTWANQFDIQIDFTETENGLKIATNQATELYNELNKIDSIQGKLVFNDLVDSLTADKGGQFENISKTTAEIAKTQREIIAVSNNIADIEKRSMERQGQISKEDKEKLEALRNQKTELQAQLNLYTQIQQRQSIDPNQYNFMDRDIPEVLKGPENYWNSVGKAFSVMKESGSTGKMEIRDFYNIVYEMENLANTAGTVFDLAGYKIGGEASQAATLIQKGLSSLTNIDGKGVKVDLSKLGIDFASGAQGAQKNFKTGIEALADSQIAMLDAAIQVLEVVVAMEELGNIDVDNNGIFSIGDIFGEQVTVGNGEKIDAYTTEFQDYAKKILKAAETNEDLRKGLENFSVNGITLKEMFEDATDRLKDLDISKEAYFAVMNSFVEAAKNGDYNLDTIQDSVWQILEQTLPDGSVINMGERSIIISGGTHTVIDWENPNVQAVIDEIGGDEEKARKTLEESFQKWQNGTSERIDLERVLKAQGKLTVDKTGKVTYNGKEYPNMTAALPDIGKDALKQMGATGPFNVEGEGDDITVTSDLQVGQHIIQVKFHDNKETYVDPETGLEAGSLKGLVDKIINTKTNNFEQFLHGNATPQQVKEFKEKLQAQLYYEYEISGTETNINGTDEEIRKLLQKSDEEIQKAIDQAVANGPDADGKYHIKFDDSDIDIDFSDQGLNADSVKQKAIEHFKNSAVLAAITQGITEAFTSTNEGNGNAVQNAITTAITNAFTQLKGLGEQEIPQVTAKITDLQITGVKNTNFGGLNALGSDFGLTSNLKIPTATAKIGDLKLTGADDVDTTSFKTLGEQIAQAIQEGLTATPVVPNVQVPSGNGDNTNNNNNNNSSSSSGESFVINTSAIDAAKTNIENGLSAIETSSATTKTALTNLGTAVNSIKDKSTEVNSTAQAINNLKSKEVTFTGTVKGIVEGIIKAHISTDGAVTANVRTNKVDVTSSSGTKAKGNVALAKGNGTLMGELGPELVVSKGRYFLVGKNGPEMVDLADDAIVFNHLQTRSLLSSGKVSTHGSPVTNERKATSLAAGNTGPAMASASEALNALKQLKAMWESLKNASLKDLGGLAGSGGGGGGGGNEKDLESVVKDIERWYNWLKEIEETQNKINTLTKEYNLLEKQNLSTQSKLANLQSQSEKRERNRNTRLQLVKEQEDKQKEVRERLNNSAFSAFYQANEDGTITLKNDEAFLNYIKNNEDVSKEVKDALASKGTAKIKVSQRKTLATAKEAENFNKKNKEISKEDYKKLNAEDKKRYKKENGKYVLKQEWKAGEIAFSTGTIKLPKSGIELFNELQKKDSLNNNIYSSEDQYAMLKKLGLKKYMIMQDNGTKLDVSTEEGRRQAVENFFAKVDAGKVEYEALAKSIQEQKDAALEDAIAIQEINSQIRELLKPVAGVTEAFDKWYNYTRKIVELQNELDILSKKRANWEKDEIANGEDIYTNMKNSLKLLEDQSKVAEDLKKARQEDQNNLVNQIKSSGLNQFINFDANGNAYFNKDKKVQLKTNQVQVKRVARNDEGYQIDTEGNYIDKEGVLRNKNKEALGENQQLGNLKYENITESIQASGEMNFFDFLDKLTKQNLNGQVLSADAQYKMIAENFGEDILQYMQYDEKGNELYQNFGELSEEVKKQMIEAGISRIKNAVEKTNTNLDELNKIDQDQLERQSSMIDIQNKLRDMNISVQQQILEAVIAEREEEIETRKEVKDAIKNAADKTIDGLKESLEKEKEIYESENKKNDLTSLQNQLAILRSSGGSSAKIRDLEKQIDEKQKDIYFDERQKSIDEIKDASDEQIEALETQISLMETQLEFQKDNGLLLASVEEILSGTSEQIVNYIKDNSKGFLGKVGPEKEKWENDLLQDVQTVKSSLENGEKQTNSQSENNSQNENNLNSPSNISDEEALGADLEFKEGESNAPLNVEEALGAILDFEENTKSLSPEELSDLGAELGFEGKIEDLIGAQLDFEEQNNNSISNIEESLNEILDFEDNLAGLYSELPLPAFDQGGDVNFTGPAWVDGTKKKPEHIFNFDQMKVLQRHINDLRANLLNSVDTTSLAVSGLQSVINDISDINTYNSINNTENSGITIEQVNLNMEVKEISNDYDARKAGQEVMEEIVRIARKNGNNSILRR